MAGRPYATDEDEAAAAIMNAAMMTDMCNAFMDRVEEARLADPTSQAELQPDPEDAALDVPEHVGDPDGASSATSPPSPRSPRSPSPAAVPEVPILFGAATDDPYAPKAEPIVHARAKRSLASGSGLAQQVKKEEPDDDDDGQVKRTFQR